MRSLRLLAFVLVLAAAPATVVVSRAAEPAPAYRVIVNPANPATRLDRRFLGDAFLKKRTRWPDGQVIRAADLRADSPVRERFSLEVVGRPVGAVRSYWQQNIFSGRDVPPPELESAESVVRYVLRHPGAIGYVGGGDDVGGAKVIGVD